jgi:hypothetical protein
MRQKVQNTRNDLDGNYVLVDVIDPSQEVGIV